MKLMTFVFLLLALNIFAQGKTEPAQNNIYLELFGNAGAYSINYDRTLIENFSIRAGVMIISLNPDFTGAVPVLINKKFYTDKNHVEIGFGATLFSIKLNLLKHDGKIVNGAVPTAVFGYCFESNSGITGRITFTPFYYNNKIIPFGGFGIGYSF